MIDKKIFYCQFGKGEKNKLNKDCIESQKKFCPDYEIIEINENNFDQTINDYTIEGYEKGNQSAVSNTARLDILSKESGFYLDTDIMLMKSLDEFRECDGGFITEYTTGQPDVGLLGRGSTFPEIYKLNQEQLIPGTTMHKIQLRNLYKMYNVHGESKHTFEDGFTVYGEEQIPSLKTNFINENTIGIHYYENSQRNNLLPISDKFYNFQKISLQLNGKEIYRDFNPTIKLTMINHRIMQKSMQVLGKLNYFFNPNVVKIETDDFIAERIDQDTTQETGLTVTASGMRVFYLT